MDPPHSCCVPGRQKEHSVPQGLGPVLSLTTMQGTQGLLFQRSLPLALFIPSFLNVQQALLCITLKTQSQSPVLVTVRHGQRLALGTGHGWQERKEGMGPRSPMASVHQPPRWPVLTGWRERPTPHLLRVLTFPVCNMAPPSATPNSGALQGGSSVLAHTCSLQGGNSEETRVQIAALLCLLWQVASSSCALWGRSSLGPGT